MAKTKTPPPTDPAERLVMHQQRRAELRRELETVLEQSIDDPSSELLKDERLRIRDELEILDAAIARCEKQIAEIAAANTEEAKAAMTKSLDDAFSRIIDRHSKLAEQDAKLCEALDNIGLLLRERDALCEEQRSDAHHIARECTRGQPERNFTGVYEQLKRHLEHKDAGAEVAARVYVAGLGRVGLSLDPFVEVRATRSDLTLAQVAEKSERATGMTLGKLIAKRKARLA